MVDTAKRGYVGIAPVSDAGNPLRGILGMTVDANAGATTVPAAAVATAGNAETYDLSASGANTLNVHISENGGTSYTTIPVTILGAAQAAVTSEEVFADMNANTMFAKFAVGSGAASTVVTLKDLGPNGKVFFSGGANAALGYTEIADGSAAAGTGTIATLSVTITDMFGKGVPLAKVNCVLYAAATGATKDATAIVNRVSKGSIISGADSNTLSLEADAEGKLVLEIGDTGVAAQTTFVEFVSAASSAIVGSRTSVTTGT